MKGTLGGKLNEDALLTKESTLALYLVSFNLTAKASDLARRGDDTMTGYTKIESEMCKPFWYTLILWKHLTTHCKRIAS